MEGAKLFELLEEFMHKIYWTLAFFAALRWLTQKAL